MINDDLSAETSVESRVYYAQKHIKSRLQRTVVVRIRRYVYIYYVSFKSYRSGQLTRLLRVAVLGNYWFFDFFFLLVVVVV